jgi:predicted aconitase
LVAEKSNRVAAAYVGMGARPSFTCAPYLLEGAPRFGQQIAWGESNAVAFANSVLGARTMKYPDFLDVCVALTGRAPLTASHTKEGRRATLRVDVGDLTGFDDAFYPLLGYHIGVIAGYEIPVITGLESAKPDLDDLKAFSAAFATTSASPMFHMVGVTPEAATLDQVLSPSISSRHVTVAPGDLLSSWRELNSATSPIVDLVSLGNPHFSLTEIARTAELCRGRTKANHVRVVITCGRDVYARAEKFGMVKELEQFGVEFLNDTCWCMIDSKQLPVSTGYVMTNSAKFAHYGPGVTGRAFHFGSLAACIEAACAGVNPEVAPVWLTPAGAR